MFFKEACYFVNPYGFGFEQEIQTILCTDSEFPSDEFLWKI